VNVLGVFAKYWQAGGVKTRLSAALGEQQAATVYQQFVLALLRRLAHTADRRTIVYWPGDRAAKFAEAAGAQWETTPQDDGDLGARMHRFFQQAFDGGAGRVVVIGSDSPTLPSEFIERAFSLLDDHDVVLGPSTDGGYYLIGAAGRVPPVFDGVHWSTSSVWPQTIGRLEAAGLRYATLEVWYDVDDFEDLRRLHDELASRPAPDAATKRLRQVVHRAVLSPAVVKRSELPQRGSFQ
jgi:rSAM/selenodomain-associated transferase 1